MRHQLFPKGGHNNVVSVTILWGNRKHLLVVPLYKHWATHRCPMTNLELQSLNPVSATTHEVHSRERFLEEPTQQLWISLSYFRDRNNSVSQLAAVRQLLPTSTKRYVCNPSVDNNTNKPAAQDFLMAFPRTQSGVTPRNDIDRK